MRSIRLAVALALPFAGVACSPDLDVPNRNAGSVNDLSGTPSAIATATAVQGIFDQSRNLLQAFFIVFTGELGREGYCMDPTNPDCVSHPLFEGPDPGRYEVTSLYYPPYVAIRAANLALHAIDGATGLTDPQKEGMRGAAKTMKALNFIYLIQVFDQSGLPIDVDRDPGSGLAPVVGRDQVYTYIMQLLDEAKVHLQAAGAAFAFGVPGGFAGFNTPATFLTVNRALAARMEVYRGSVGGGAANYNAALTALGESFINSTTATLANLNVGAYHSFSTGAGDLTVSQFVYDPTSRIVMAHGDLDPDAQTGPGGKDARFTRKVVLLAAPRTLQGVTSQYGFTIYNSPGASIPIIRNEELILLRAEANIGLLNDAAAIADINFVRSVSGGLLPITSPYVPGVGQPPTLLDELLYEKRYSLLWEGHRWVDMRRYGKLLELPRYAPNHVIYPYWPLAEAECVPRTPQPAGCTRPTPL